MKHIENTRKADKATVKDWVRNTLLCTPITVGGKRTDVGDFIDSVFGYGESYHYAQNVIGEIILTALKRGIEKKDLKNVYMAALIKGGPYILYEVSLIKKLVIEDGVFNTSEIERIYRNVGCYDLWVDETLEELNELLDENDMRQQAETHEFVFRGEITTIKEMVEKAEGNAACGCGGYDTIFYSRRNATLIDEIEEMEDYGLIDEAACLREFAGLGNLTSDEAYSLKQEAFDEVMEDFI